MLSLGDTSYRVLNDVIALAPELFVGPNAQEQAQGPAETVKKEVGSPNETELNKLINSTKTPAEIKKEKQKKEEPSSNTSLVPWSDRVATSIFSFDAALNNKIRRTLTKLKVSWPEMSKVLNRLSVSQALHAETIAQQFLKYGEIIYDRVTGQFEVKDNPDAPSFNKLMEKMDSLAVKYGIKPETFKKMVHKNFVAKRAAQLAERNAQVERDAKALIKQGKKDQAKEFFRENYIVIDLTKSQIDTAIDFGKSYPEINELHDMWIDSKNNLIDFLVESELMTPNQADEFINVVDVEGAPKETKEGTQLFSGDTYVPFFREDTDKKPREYRDTRLGDRGKYHKLKGSYEPVADVFENMQLWMRDSVKRGIMNRKAIDKIEAIESLPEAVQKEIMEVNPTKPDANTIAMSRVISKTDEKTGDTTYRKVVVNYGFSDSFYAHAFTGMDRAALSGLGFFSNVSNFLRTNVVLYPLFSIAQLPQDSVSAMFSSGVRNPFMIPLRVMAQFPLTLLDMSKTHKDLQRFGATGGLAYLQNETAADRDVNLPGFYNATRRAMGKVPGLTPNSAVKLGDKKLSVTGFLNRLAMASDNAVRQAVYDQTMKETNNQALAVDRAFEVINFKRAGASSAVTGLRQVVPFFGAFLQAASVQGRTITGRGITPQERAKGLQQFLMTGMQLAGISLLYSALATDDEEYEKLDPTIRDRRFLLGNGAHITLRPDLFTYMFKIMPEHILQNMIENQDNKKTYDSLVRGLRDTASVNIIPQAIRPILNVAYGYDPLTRRPIKPQSLEDRTPARQFTAGTSEFAKLLARSSGISDPITVDYFLRQYFGYTGGLITMMASSMIDEYDLFDYDRATKSDRDLLASIPGMSNFISKEYGNRHTTDYYELKGETTKAVKAYKDLLKLGFDSNKTQEYLKENFKEITTDPLVQGIQQNLSVLRKERNKLLEMPRTMITADEKKEALDRISEFEKVFLSQIRDIRKGVFGTGFKAPD